MGVIEFVYDDGGRAEAGYKGSTGDCACRAVAIATGKPYSEIYAAINEYAALERPRGRKKRSHARTGVHRVTMDRLMKQYGFKWVPTMKIGTGCKIHLKADELPSGIVVASVSKHYVTLIDGVIHDTGPDVDREGTRCVYGIWVRDTSISGMERVVSALSEVSATTHSKGESSE